MLSSIGSKEEAPPGSAPKSRPETDGVSTSKGRSEPVREGTAKASATQLAALPKKRKAEDDISKANEKIPKISQDGGPTSAATPSTNSQRPLPSDKVLKSSTTPTLKVPYRGTSRPSAQDGASPFQAPPKDRKRPTVTTTSLTKPAPNRDKDKAPTPTVVTPSTPTEGTKPPKKGSYKEIMARAKALQNNPPVGVIKHQPKDKKALSDKKELLLQKKGLAGKPKPIGTAGHRRNSSGDVSGGSRPGSSGRPEEPVKKRAPEIAYKGTAKPKPQPTYKGTMKPAPAITLPSHRKPPVKPDDRSRSNSMSRPVPAKSRRREYSEEEDEDEEEEEEVDYESGSDMEAGYSDVEEEETKATKIAKKEDEYEALMEATLKKQKEAKKKRVAELLRNQERNQY